MIGVVAALGISLTCIGVRAQESGSTGPVESDAGANRGISAYPAAFFAELGAVSAMDMIQQTPGFAFQDADNSRGYAGAGGNVLINGRRPSTKTTRLRQILQRIPAAGVDRIEVIRGSSPDIDMQGQPIVANIVRRSGASETGAVQGVGKFYPNGEAGAIGRIEKSRRTDELFFEGWAEIRRERQDEEAGDGPIVAKDGSGNVTGRGRYLADSWTERVRGLGNFEKETRNGLFRANMAFAHDVDEEQEIQTVNSMGGGQSRDVTDSERRVRRLELGADYDGPVGENSSMQLVALQTLTWENDDASRANGNELQLAKEGERSGETILRGLLRHPMSPKTTFEAGAEGAFNYLDSDSRLSENGQPIDLPSGNVEVEELRAEVFSTLTLQPSDRMSLEFGLRAESSQLRVSGDADAENDFSFLKPRVIAAFSTRSGALFRTRIEREVGQLDFDDFAAGSELADGTVNAGNPNLGPERSWVFEGAFERPILGDGAFSITYRHYELEEVVDLIPVQGFDAPGNIGDGTRQEWAISLSLPMETIGPGLGRLQMSGTWRESEVVDPVTGERREISGESPFEGAVVYSRDFPALDGTFGFRGELTGKETAYRVDQVIASRSDHYWRVYWDWRARPDIQVRFQLENATSRDRWRNRIRYDGPRSDGIVASQQRRSAVFDPIMVVRVRWIF